MSYRRGSAASGASTPTLDCVCDDCNGYFGRELDQLLTRDTYEGIFRYSRGQLSSQARPQKRVSLDARRSGRGGRFPGPPCLGRRHDWAAHATRRPIPHP